MTDTIGGRGMITTGIILMEVNVVGTIVQYAIQGATQPTPDLTLINL